MMIKRCLFAIFAGSVGTSLAACGPAQADAKVDDAETTPVGLGFEYTADMSSEFAGTLGNTDEDSTEAGEIDNADDAHNDETDTSDEADDTDDTDEADDTDGPQAASEAGLRTMAAKKKKEFVGVPSGYVYKPSRGSLHDYCTASPDEFPAPIGPNAKFQGPCARHDLCYAGKTDKKVCDVRLLKDMRTNCRYTYGKWNPYRKLCYKTAAVYFAAVVVAN